jgi:hypothetical protein
VSIDSTSLAPTEATCARDLELLDFGTCVFALLDDQEARLLRLDLLGYRSHEIAEELGVPASTVRVRKKRLLDRLRQEPTIRCLVEELLEGEEPMSARVTASKTQEPLQTGPSHEDGPKQPVSTANGEAPGGAGDTRALQHSGGNVESDRPSRSCSNVDSDDPPDSEGDGGRPSGSSGNARGGGESNVDEGGGGNSGDPAGREGGDLGDASLRPRLSGTLRSRRDAVDITTAVDRSRLEELLAEYAEICRQRGVDPWPTIRPDQHSASLETGGPAERLPGHRGSRHSGRARWGLGWVAPAGALALSVLFLVWVAPHGHSLLWPERTNRSSRASTGEARSTDPRLETPGSGTLQLHHLRNQADVAVLPDIPPTIEIFAESRTAGDRAREGRFVHPHATAGGGLLTADAYEIYRL